MADAAEIAPEPMPAVPVDAKPVPLPAPVVTPPTDAQLLLAELRLANRALIRLATAFEMLAHCQQQMTPPGASPIVAKGPGTKR